MTNTLFHTFVSSQTMNTISEKQTGTNIITTEVITSTLCYDEKNRLLITRVKKDSDVCLANIEKDFKETDKFTNSNKLLLLLDIRAMAFNHIPKETMQYLSKNPYNKNQIAAAILIEGLGLKLIGNFYLNVYKPEVNTKLFLREDVAKKWLKKVGNK